MFSGIIEAVGSIRQIETINADKRFTIETGKLDLSDIAAGDSICVNGVCLTAVDICKGGFVTDVSTETLSCTTFDILEIANQVNLEKALRLGDRLSGHIVSGHVDGVGKIKEFHADARSTQYQIGIPASLNRYLCKKGSICVDGVSLTVNDVDESSFTVNIIPHTLDETIFSSYQQETEVNLEIDLIARYLEGLIKAEHN